MESKKSPNKIQNLIKTSFEEKKECLPEEIKDQTLLANPTKKLKFPKILINTSRSRGELKLLRQLIDKNSLHGWKEVQGLNGHILWSGTPIGPDEIHIAQHIKVNRLPYMQQLSHKKMTGLFLSKFRAFFPEEFDFFPRTWLIPEEINELESYMKDHPEEIFISKPTAGSQGDGILLLRKFSELSMSMSNSKLNELVVQKYLDKPLLIDGKKFDLRLYVLISNVKPMLAFLNQEGLSRFCTENYEKPTNENIKNYYMHLTNYSLNKLSNDFILTDELFDINNGSKQTLCSTWKALEKQGHNKDLIMKSIESLIVKFLVSMEPFIHFYYNTTFEGKDNGKCFHLLGFDILLDEDLKPWLLEINSNPSLNIDFDQELPKLKSIPSKVDTYVKTKVVEDALLIVQKKVEKQVELSNYRSYKLIYNSNTNEFLYMSLMKNLLEIFGKLSGIRYKPNLSSSRFCKLATFSGMTHEKFTKTDYDLLFGKILNGAENKQMDFINFITVIEKIASKLFPDFDPCDKTPFIERIIDRVLPNL